MKLVLLCSSLLLGGCSLEGIYSSDRTSATIFAYEFQPQLILGECLRDLGYDRRGGGGGGGRGGSRVSHSFSAHFVGEELQRSALMELFEQRMDAAMTAEGLKITGRGRWSPMPGFRRRYEHGRQQGVLSVYSVVGADGHVYVRGELEESPR